MSLLEMRRHLSYSAPYIWDKYEIIGPGEYEYIERIYSEAADYPYDGEQDGYYYRMVKGTVLRYVWNIYLAVSAYGWKEKSRSASQGVVRVSLPKQSSDTLFSGANYSFDDATGMFTLTNRFPDVSGQAYTGDQMGRVFYQVRGEPTYAPQTTLYYSDYYPPADEGSSWALYPATIITRETDTTKIIHSKGSSAGQTAESVDPLAYPQDGYDDSTGFWYTYSRSYWYTFDDR